MSEEWRCPACDFRSKSFNGVRVHFIKMHMNGKCPACGKKYRSLMRHFERRSDCDLMHAICYGLAAHNQGRGSRRHEAQEWFRECRNLAYEVLKC